MYQPRDLPGLVALRLTFLFLEIDEIGNARTGKDSMTSLAANFSKSQSFDQSNEITKSHVVDVPADNAGKETLRCH